MLFSTEVQQRILASIRSGGTPEAAAESWGVPAKTLRYWLRDGRKPGSPYGPFAAEVRQAQSQARLRAQAELLQKNSRAWLEFDQTEQASPEPNALLATKALALLRQAAKLLIPFPDARQRLVEWLEAKPKKR